MAAAVPVGEEPLRRGLREMVRVVRPGGVVLLAGWSGSPRNRSCLGLAGAVQRASPLGPPPVAPWSALGTAGALRDALVRAGLEDVRTATELRPWRAPSAAWVAERLPSLVALDDPAARRQVAIELDRVLRDRFAGGPVELDTEVHFAWGRVPAGSYNAPPSVQISRP